MNQPQTTINVITSKDNQYMKLARALQQKKQRTEQGLFLTEGLRNTRELLQSDVEISFLLVADEKQQQPELQNLLELAGQKQAKLFVVAEQILRSTSCTEENQGVVAVAAQKQYSAVEFFQAAAGKPIAILDGLQDPGNVGTILRTAWAAGLGGILLVNHAAEIYNPKVVRAAMGALYHLPVLEMDNEEAAEFLAEQGYQLLTADAEGLPYYDFRLQAGAKAAWLLGNEGSGPSEFWRQQSKHTVAIPMAAKVESLNVAVAAGILFFAKIQ